ncbi:MAG TPA: J domain-containing protein [Candidatus Aquicultor sp.]
MSDYYKTLQVDPEASPEVIEKAYKALSLKYHPDKQPSEKKEEATHRWMQIREAFEILSDAKRRSEYDVSRREEAIGTFLNEGLIGLYKRYVK